MYGPVSIMFHILMSIFVIGAAPYKEGKESLLVFKRSLLLFCYDLQLAERDIIDKYSGLPKLIDILLRSGGTFKSFL